MPSLLLSVGSLTVLSHTSAAPVASVAVEDVIYRHDSVLAAAVVSVPHDKLGEEVA